MGVPQARAASAAETVHTPGQVVEIRVHGVSGTPPESMLDDREPVVVGGDDTARFLRRRHPVPTGEFGARTVEALHWGRMTAGSAGKALWLLLAPFGLLNLARYTLPMRPPADPGADGAEGTEIGRGARRTADGTLRLLGLALTLLLVGTVAFVTIDLIAWQCAGSAVCAKKAGWLPVADSGLTTYNWRLLMAIVPPFGLVYLLWWFGRQVYLFPPETPAPTPGAAQLPDPTGGPQPWGSPVGDLRDTGFWYDSVQAPVLRILHTTAAMALLAFLVGYSTVTAPAAAFGGPLPEWVRTTLWTLSGVTLAVVLLAASLVTVGWHPERPRFDPSGEDPVALPLALVRLRDLSVLAVFVTAGVAAVGTHRTVRDQVTNLPGFETTFHVLYLTIGVLLLGLGAATWRLAARTRPGAGVPARFRPMFRGAAAPVIVAVAVLLATGFTAGTAIQIARLIGKPAPAGAGCPTPCLDPPIAVPDVHRITAIGWGILAALLGVVVLLVGLVFLARTAAARLFRAPDPAGVDARGAAIRADYAGDGLHSRTVLKIARSWTVASLKFRAPHVVFVLGVFGAGVIAVQVALAAAVLVAGARIDELPATRWLTVLNDTGAWLVTGVVLSLAFLGFRAFRSEKMRRGVGITWDLLAFWPRLAHPIVPPPYGGRTVLALARRAAYHARDKNVHAVVLSGHSQGSLIAAATVGYLSQQDASLPPEERVVPKLRLFTFGSQLQWAYPRLFPAYIGYHRLVELNEEVLRRRWFNLHRWTDPLGAPVLAYPMAPATGPYSGEHRPPPAGEPGGEDDWFELTASRSKAHRTELLSLPGDTRALLIGEQEYGLRDPIWAEPSDERPTSPILGHGGYHSDPAFDEILLRLVRL